jgi:NNP family nitrate/nitrite transporter-like MFS transporter
MKILILLLCWSLWYLSFTTRVILSPLLPVIEDEFAIGHALAGGLYFYQALGYTAALFFAGWLASRIGYKWSIVSGFLLLVVALFLFRFANSYGSFAAVTLVMGIGGGIYLPSAIPLITSLFKPKNWGKAIGFHETAASLAILTIPLLTVLFFRFLHWRDFFTLMSAACLLVIALFWALAPDPKHRAGGNIPLSSIFQRRDFWIMVALCSVAGMAASGLYNITPLFLVKERGMALEMANKVFGISRIGGFLMTILAGFLMDRIGAKKMLWSLLLITGISTMGIALSNIFWLLVTMLVVQATVSVAFFPVALFAVSKLTSLRERSLYTSIVLGFTAIIGSGLAPVVLGAIADNWNFQIGILFLGVVTTLACFLLRGLREI